MSFALRTLPGVAICVAVATAAMSIQFLEQRITGELYLEALVIAIVLGTIIRTGWTPGPRLLTGIDFSAKILLEIAVVLLGTSISAGTVLALGPVLLMGIAAVVAIAIGSSYAICRVLRLPPNMALLIACGNSICGNSAIAAVAPVIGANGDDVASAIAFTAVLGVSMVIGLPLLVPILGLSLTQYGVLAGLTVYAVPQVLAATLPIGALSNQVGTVIKLVRVLMLGPVVLCVSLVMRRSRGQTGAHETILPNRPAHDRLSLHELVPWFIVGFLVFAGLRTIGVIPASALDPIRTTANVLTTVAMAALGLSVDVRVIASASVRVATAVILSLIVLGCFSLLLIRVAVTS